MFPLAFVAGSLQGHWWGFISRNYVVWPIFSLMNVFIALKGTQFLNFIWAEKQNFLPGRAPGADAWTKTNDKEYFSRAGQCAALSWFREGKYILLEMVGFSGRNAKSFIIFRVGCEKGHFFRKHCMWKGMFSQKLGTHCLGSFRRSFSSIGPIPTPTPLGIGFPHKARCYERRRRSAKS